MAFNPSGPGRRGLVPRPGSSRFTTRCSLTQLIPDKLQFPQFLDQGFLLKDAFVAADFLAGGIQEHLGGHDGDLIPAKSISSSSM